MQVNRTNTVRVGCLLSLLILIVAGGVLFTRYQSMTSCLADRTPLKNINIAIDPNQEELFIEQSRKFAFKHEFRFDTVPFTQNSSDWRIRMIGNDVEVIARNTLNAGGFEIAFYNYNCVHPVVASDIEGLVNDFKSFLSEVPTVLITE